MNIPAITNCPHCEKQLVNVFGGHITISIPGGTNRAGIAYTCPHCRKLLSMEMDPLAVKTEIVAELMARLGR